MVSSEVEIVNSALIKIGEQTITSLSDDRQQAQVARRQYPIKRDELLRMYRWNFAVARATLAPLAEKPAFGFSNQFETPTDAIKIIGLYDGTQMDRNYTGSHDVWKVEGTRILANSDSLSIFYIKQVTNPLNFDPIFVETLSWFLAADLAFNLTASADLVEVANQGFAQALRQARMNDAVEGTPEVLTASEWLDSRITSAHPHDSRRFFSFT